MQDGYRVREILGHRSGKHVTERWIVDSGLAVRSVRPAESAENASSDVHVRWSFVGREGCKVNLSRGEELIANIGIP